MKNTQFKVEDVFDDILGKESILPEQITKNFVGQNDVNINISINVNLFEPRKK